MIRNILSSQSIQRDRLTQVFSMQPSKTPGNQLFCDGARYTRVAVRFVLM